METTKTIVKTKSGSTYILNKEKMTWARPVHSPESDQVRTSGGILNEWPEIYVGEPMVLLGPPLEEGATVRIITTTPVIEIMWREIIE